MAPVRGFDPRSSVPFVNYYRYLLLFVPYLLLVLLYLRLLSLLPDWSICRLWRMISVDEIRRSDNRQEAKNAGAYGFLYYCRGPAIGSKTRESMQLGDFVVSRGVYLVSIIHLKPCGFCRKILIGVILIINTAPTAVSYLEVASRHASASIDHCTSTTCPHLVSNDMRANRSQSATRSSGAFPMWQLVLHGRSKFYGAWGRGGNHAERHPKSGADVAAAARSAQILLLRKQV